jgi:ABC-2 type transport system ATP-binding protein
MLDHLHEAGVEVEGLTVHTPDLDDVFLALTGHPDSTVPREAVAR